MPAIVDRLAALPVALLPRHRWDDWDLPVADVSLLSATLTFFGGAALGITGYFRFMEYVLAQREWTAPPLMLTAYISYVFLTPRGLGSLYLVLSGGLRMISGWIDEPLGDPLLTAADAVLGRRRRSRRERAAAAARHALEGPDQPDRRYPGAWAGLDAVDLVIVCARRKPGWTKGTFVVTGEGWFTLGEPFDRRLPQGLRTIYPLTRHRTHDVVRRSVEYELPPTQMAQREQKAQMERQQAQMERQQAQMERQNAQMERQQAQMEQKAR